MTDAPALAERLLSLLDESARVSTYKSALLLALVDRSQEHLVDGVVPVRALAERVIELYWPQTLAYPTTGEVLLQNQGGQAEIISALLKFRGSHGVTWRHLPQNIRSGKPWESALTRVERTLAEYPIPRLQRPFEPFLYDFDWGWAEAGGWSVRQYEACTQALRLHPGVGEALVSLGPLLRPFITRWWTEKAAQLNPNVEAARSVIEFEYFLFGRDRVALQRIGESLLDLQRGECFYCGARIARTREIDHFIPWSRSGDDGLDNLVAACRRCNNDKRAALPTSDYIDALLGRNGRWDGDLESIARERQWPRNRSRSLAVMRTAYLTGSTDRPLWHWDPGSEGYTYVPLREERPRIASLLA